MKYEYKYLTGEMYNKAAKLFEEHPDVMIAYGKECGRAQVKGYQVGEAYGTAIGVIVTGAIVGGTAFIVKKVKEHKRKKKEKTVTKKYIEI